MQLFEKNPAVVWMALLGGLSTSAALTLSFITTSAPESIIHGFPHGLMGMYIGATALIFSNYKLLNAPLNERILFASILFLSLYTLPAAVWAIRAVG